MKKNGYLRSFLALFLAFVMIMADSSVTTFAATVGMVSQQNATVIDVTVNAPDGTYYLAALESYGSWYAARSKVVKAEVIGGSTTVSLQPSSDISNAQIVLLALKQGGYREDYDGSVYKVIPNNSILDYTKKVSCGEIINNSAEINVTELGNKTVSNVFGSLGSATNYAVFAGEFHNDGDMEGNIATDLFYSDGGDIGDSGNVGKYTDALMVHVTKSVSGLKSAETFNFGLFDNSDKLIEVKSLTFSSNGTSSFDFTQINTKDSNGTGASSYKYAVYELEENANGNYAYGSKKYNKVADKYKDFSVSYNENTAIEIFNNDNFVGTANGKVKLRDGNLYTKAKVGELTVEGQINNVKYSLSDSDFTSMVTNGEYTSGGVSAMISGKLKTLADDLGKAKTGDGNQVIYITPDVLTGNQVDLPYNGDILSDSAQTLVINVVVPNGTSELNLFGSTIGQLNVGGTNIMNEKGWSKAGLHIIWNYIDEAGNSFTGTVKLHGGQAPGIQLLPAGTLYSGNNISQLDIAKVLHQFGGEIHKAPIQGKHHAYVRISNAAKEKNGTYIPVVKKVLNGRGLKEGEFSFTITEVDKDGKTVDGGYTDTAANAADGTVSFQEITYSKPGTYYYKVVEDVPAKKLEGVTYSSESYTITVTVSDDGKGKLTAAADKSLDALVFTNAYNASGSYQPAVKKVLNGRGLKEGEFSFTITEVDKDGKTVDGGYTDTAANAADGTVSFQEITYSKPGTYYYKVVEDVPAKKLEGVTYSSESYTITVTVSDDGKGKLTAAADKSLDALVFTNAYNASGSYQPAVKKVLNGRGLKEGEFSFTITEVDKDGKTVDGGYTDTAANAADGTVSFQEITYSKPGTYYYKVVEDVPAKKLEGVTYSSESYTITVTVSDDGKGKLTAAADKSLDALVFTNAYNASGSYQPAVKKVLNGRGLKEGEFSFTITEVDKDGKTVDGGYTDTAANAADGTVSFQEIIYSKPGTYYYKVVEDVPAKKLEGVTYSSESYTITVTVSDDGKGKLTAAADKSLDALVFTNAYNASGSYQPAVKKVLNGRGLKEGEFSFTITEVDKDGKTVDGGYTDTAANAADGTVSFQEITYSKPGTYYYKVVEDVPAKKLEGVTYSSESYTITVTVSDDGKGKLTAAADKSLDALVFTNAYNASGSYQPAVKKVLNGRGLKEGEFSFTITEVDKDGKTVDGGYTDTAANAADGTVSFQEIIYSKPGTYYYKVAEDVPAKKLEGVTYSSESYTITVTVSDDGKGKLTAAADKSLDALVFTNAYNASGSYQPAVKKVLNGRGLKEGEFSFTITEVDKDGKTVDGGYTDTAANAADGTVSFQEITYSKPGTYYYKVVEDVPAKKLEGVTYSSESYTITVTVSDDGKGKLTAAADKSLDALVFTNAYNASGSYQPAVKKVLNGRGLKEGEFSFTITEVDKDGKTVDGGYTDTAANAADGTVSFQEIIYSKPGTYYYKVAEDVPAKKLEGVTYSSESYTITVTVSDDGKGKLTAAADKSLDALVFTNAYNASGSYQPAVKKVLNGRGLKEGEFSFTITEVDKDGKTVDGGYTDTAANAADGTVSFQEITYSKPGTYYYKVVEDVPAKKLEGVTYSSESYTITVTVSDDGKGKLTAAADKSLDALVFTNAYNASGSYQPAVKKVLNGRGLKEGEFSFTITEVDKDGKTVDGGYTDTAANAADGTVSFQEITYSKPGTYYYKVVEDVPAKKLEGVTYSSESYTITVTVSDDGKGKLTAAADKSLDALVFTNEYNATGETTLTATKTLSGREFQKGDNWTFTVTCDDANAPMPEHPVVTTTATSGTSTTLDFGKIHYTIADVNKDYVYTITESGNVANVTNDPVAARTVTVSVRDKGDGTLNVTQEVTGAGLTFTNKYADGETTLGVTKVLSGREFKSGDEWTFKLTADKGTPMPAQTVVKTDATSGNSQSLSFGTIKYTLADVGNTYTYTIHETGSAEGVTNDPNATRIVTVTVNEGKDGKLDIVREEPKGEIVFTNTYDAKGSLTLEASKTLKNKALEADAFNFVLKDENGETIQTVSNDADGNVAFSPLNYTLKDVGTHVYTVSEVQRENTEVTYDTTEYTVEVTVADAGNGKLKVSKTIKKGDDTVDAIAFENIYKGVIDISGSKTWNDADNQDGIRPASITVKLFANGTEAASQVVTPDEAGNWNYVFKNLPQYDVNGKISYTVTEDAVAGYETSVSGYNITNTHKPATLDITGTKTWNDSNNQDGKRPKSITVNLLANGIITDTKTVTADDNWTYSFTDLPKYANGQEITYTVSELTVPGYTTTIDDNYNITNSYTPGETSASVTKIWDDADNQDGIRPESITVALLANGTPTNKTVTLTAANNWTQTITGLPEKADGEYITYTWTEVNVPEGYSLTGTSKNETVTTLTNTHTPELTSITGTKTWKDADNQDGKRPESITVNLFADGTKLKSQSVSADADGNWSYSFTDLPKYANGQEITYTVTEDAVDGYTTESDGYNFINTHQPETTEITGTKTWNDANNQDGKRPESITVILLANGTEKTRQAVTADEVGNWTYTFKDLPKYANGQEITYTVAEEEVTDYTTTYDGSNITNSYTPGKTSATVTKIWNDAENQDGKRPESITVSLLADGKETGKTVTLSVENNWKQTISDLPEKADGKAIEYTWTEETLPEGYELTDNSKNGTVTTLTNTYAPETTSITVTKTWDDADNQDGKRPESIIVNLLANGEIVASQTVKADEAGNWTYTFKDLPKYANGKEITYTVTEEAVEGYETSVDGFNITNTYTTETTEVKGSKTWNDADNQDGKRPESITVRLLANGEEKDSQTVTADENGNWTYSFEKLPKYEAGKEIVYTVTEDAVADYTTEITGYDITNSYAPGKTSVTVTKAWADNDDRGGHRPKEIKVQLKADGENSGEEIILNAENKWTYTWSELDEKKAGKDIVYTVEEIGKTAGYISTVTGNATEGFIITNTITSVKISKVDITDQKELAGAHIQILDKDGNVVDEWDSTWESHEVTGLKTGEKYTLRETVAPDGYTITADTVFSLKEDGTLDKDNTSTTISADGTLLVEDSRTSVKVSKVDISDGKELEGAHIQIIDQDGNVVDEWDSTKEAHVTEKLKTGKIYTLRETVAPDGYLLTSDTTFVLKEDGTVDAEKTTAVSKDGVLLVQDKLATSASIAVTKKLTYIGEGLAARNQTFYVALYSDKECTQRVSDVKALVFKNADASTVVFSENIKAGKTYYIAECTQDGTSQTIGALADGTVYEAVFGNGNSTTVTEANGTTTVSFENVFSSFPPDGFYKQGQLTITKKVLGADGGTRNSNEVFYAGIFDDAAHTQLSQQVEQNIIKLDMDGGYEVSEIINVGLAQSGAKVTLYVTETDSNGKPIAGSEGFGYKVTVSADSVIFDETNMTAEVVITNQEESTVTETPTPTPSSDGGNSGGSENHSGGYGGGKSPKTGDDTPIGTYLMLLLAAAMLAAETERRRRRNKRQ